MNPIAPAIAVASSADRLHPEWQELEVGDVLRSGEGKPGMRVEILEPERALVNRSETGDWG